MRSLLMVVALASPMVASSRSGNHSSHNGTGTVTPKPHTPAPATVAKAVVHHNGTSTRTSTLQHGQSHAMHAGNQPKINTLIYQRQ
jgi:hypothetical protein